jgi:hypothetical protein
MANQSTELTLQELRKIIHGLKMSGFCSLDDAASDEIRSMIKILPSAETILTLTETPMAIDSLKENIGRIMRLIELYSKRDMEYKVRYKSRTGLPPRYKVMDWRKAMKMSVNSSLISGLVKTSASVDELGYGDMAERFLKCAKNAQSNNFSVIELIHATADTFEKIGFIDDASSIRKTAQASELYELGTEDISGGIQQLYTAIDSVINIVKRKWEQLGKDPKTLNVRTLLGNLQSSLVGVKDSLKKPIGQLQKSLPQIEQEMQAAVPEYVLDPQTKAPLKIQWTEPDEKGEQTGYVTINFENHEIQRDERTGGLIINPKPMAAAKPVAPSVKAPEAVSKGETPAGTTGGMTEEIGKLDAATIDSILKLPEFQSVASNNVQYKVSQAATNISPAIMSYINQIKGNPEELKKFKVLLNQQKNELAKKAPPAHATPPAVETPAVVSIPTPVAPTGEFANVPNNRLPLILKNLNQQLKSEQAKVGFNRDDLKIREYNEKIQAIQQEMQRRKGPKSFNLSKYLKSAKKSV